MNDSILIKTTLYFYCVIHVHVRSKDFVQLFAFLNDQVRSQQLSWLTYSVIFLHKFPIILYLNDFKTGKTASTHNIRISIIPAKSVAIWHLNR